MTSQTFRPEEISVRTVTLAQWPDMQALFDEPGPQRGCWCMYWRVKRAEFHAGYGERLRQAMEEIIASGRVPGILAYHGDRPVGWCSVAPREEFSSLERSPTLRRVDTAPAWSIVCFFVRRDCRHRGLSDILAGAAVTYARQQGARVVEAYPLLPERAENLRYEQYMGMYTTFERLGFREAAPASGRRAIVRLDVLGGLAAAVPE